MSQVILSRNVVFDQVRNLQPGAGFLQVCRWAGFRKYRPIVSIVKVHRTSAAMLHHKDQSQVRLRSSLSQPIGCRMSAFYQGYHYYLVIWFTRCWQISQIMYEDIHFIMQLTSCNTWTDLRNYKLQAVVLGGYCSLIYTSQHTKRNTRWHLQNIH